MARSAVLSGRALSDIVYNAGILVVLMVSGSGRRLAGHTAPSLEFLAGVGLLLLFTFAMSWVGIWLGLTVPTVEVAEPGRLHVHLPAHVHLERLRARRRRCPSWLQPVAEWNPVSVLTAATRELWGNPNPYATTGFPAEHPVLLT